MSDDIQGDQLPKDTVEVLRRILFDSKEGFAVLTSERTQHLLNRFNSLRSLKFKGSVRIPLVGKIGK